MAEKGIDLKAEMMKAYETATAEIEQLKLENKKLFNFKGIEFLINKAKT